MQPRRLLPRIVVAMALLQPLAAVAVLPHAVYLTPADALPGTQVKIGNTQKDAPIALSADEMGMDHEHHIVIARGKVEVMQGDAILTADQITYYQDSDLVIAQGKVTMLQPSGDVYFAEKAELQDAMKQAVIQEFKARFADNSVLVAQQAVKVNSSLTKLHKASYTPCNLCENMAPFWQMNASDASVDDVEEQVTYHGAFMEMFGYPMFYTPYLSHPTPDASAKSGLLTPVYSTKDNLGTVVKVPYYWRIAPDKDVVLTPWVTTAEGPLLQWDYNQLRDFGDYHVRGSITYPKQLDASGNEVSGHELRGHVFAQGDEALTDDTHIGFDIQHASDDTYLRRYGFGDQQALFSRVYAEQAQGRNFALAEGVAIQGLRSTDNARTTPLMLPILQGYRETAPYDNGLKLHVAADAQLLTREEGADQRRISVTPGATLPFVTEDGHVFTANVSLRQDLYNSNNVPITGSTDTFSGNTTRTMPQAALEWRLPLINQLSRGAWLVEPVLLGVAQPNGNNPEKISNEDAKLLELSDTNLFSLERMPGLDLVDSGSRVAYGMRSHYYDSSGVALDGLLGQNYSFNSDTPFPNSTRAGEQFSDYIGRFAANYAPFALTYRFALDNRNATFNRNEVGLGFTHPWFAVYSSYSAIKNNRYLPDSQEGVINATLPLGDEWSLYGGARRDLELNQMVTANGGIIYKNECFNIILDSLRVYTRDRDVAPSTQFTFRVGFKNLGEFGGK